MLIILILITISDVFSRYIFNLGSIFLQEIEWHLFDIIFLFGVAYALAHNKHIRVDIFYSRYSKKIKCIIDIISNLFIIVPFSILILYYSIDFISISFIQNESSSNPNGLCCRFLIKFSIFLAFLMVILQAISEAIKNFLNLKKLTKTEEVFEC